MRVGGVQDDEFVVDPQRGGHLLPHARAESRRQLEQVERDENEGALGGTECGARRRQWETRRSRDGDA